MFWESCRLSDVILRFIFLALKCFSSMLRELPEASDVLCFLFVFGININFSILKELPEAVDGAVVPSYNLSSHWAGWVIACFSINFHPFSFCNFYHLLPSYNLFSHRGWAIFIIFIILFIAGRLLSIIGDSFCCWYRGI